VTLHNRGLALRRLADLDRERSREHLAGSSRSLEEAAEIRQRHALADGRARSLFHRGVTLLRLAREDEDDPDAGVQARQARQCLEDAAALFDDLGKSESAESARRLAEEATRAE